MPDQRKIYLLGKPNLTPEEQDDLEEIGEAIAACGQQLITAQVNVGTSLAVATGYIKAGGKPEYFEPGLVPDDRNILIIADEAFHDRIAQRVPDWKARGWLMIFDVHRLNIETLKYMADHGITLRKDGDGEVNGAGGGDITEGGPSPTPPRG
jgi:hypothetical protein